mmetsp:Transcript_7120/g.20978  ORF Transcript_7120/g.20978 Transcript_7120/m.20978 type:complete len:232 (-) Transcript_7120:952-1647(-)
MDCSMDDTRGSTPHAMVAAHVQFLIEVPQWEYDQVSMNSPRTTASVVRKPSSMMRTCSEKEVRPCRAAFAASFTCRPQASRMRRASLRAKPTSWTSCPAEVSEAMTEVTTASTLSCKESNSRYFSGLKPDPMGMAASSAPTMPLLSFFFSFTSVPSNGALSLPEPLTRSGDLSPWEALTPSDRAEAQSRSATAPVWSMTTTEEPWQTSSAVLWNVGPPAAPPRTKAACAAH